MFKVLHDHAILLQESHGDHKQTPSEPPWQAVQASAGSWQGRSKPLHCSGALHISQGYWSCLTPLLASGAFSHSLLRRAFSIEPLSQCIVSFRFFIFFAISSAVYLSPFLLKLIKFFFQFLNLLYLIWRKALSSSFFID